MRKIIYCVLLLTLLASCKECGKEKEPEVSFDIEGVYGVYNANMAGQVFTAESPASYDAVCIEIQKPDTLIVRFLDLTKITDVSLQWSKVEEGKYKINTKGQNAYFYDYIIRKHAPELTLMLSYKVNKPDRKDTENYTTMTKLFNHPTLDSCADSMREELQRPSDPGPENNWGQGK
ncbi:hypothetical protein [Leptospira andrefontaineae]|uniref:Lipoprotein n=1 Tax=Leptospira andrefontaineae TaxID=2484976 RepID=A0A4R9HAX9_9LEPT|nr:hypothetical protein [Leptospira andrefontaineae]TGK43542.1 hypothetical protein EHO65_02565 [Leptospira andrefontaineae]